ncbi:A-kinase anchor protein 9-like isoform X1 [Diaphorina citri]|uniref:A-kinase anchor protein 9-like isoform X1 n=2 Tax=Diaphorina citri TaxID=121845 RepID=A0A1S3DUY4_DIACI|nr:A-kinase anchor protein 9-like isoform X1 [Diaphorina citri]
MSQLYGKRTLVLKKSFPSAMLSVLTANSNATPHSLLSKRETSPSIGTEYKDGIDCQDGANNKDGIDYKAGANYKDKMGYKDGANNKDGIEYKAGANYKDKMGYKDGPPSASNQTKQENRSADSSNFLSSISRNMEQTDAESPITYPHPSSSGDSSSTPAHIQHESQLVRNLYRDYELEKATRIEAEKAFRNLMILYEEKSNKFRTAVEGNRQAFEIANEMKEKYDELKIITDENITKLNNAHADNDILKMIVTQEKRKTDKLKNEMKLLKQPPLPDHTACDIVLDQANKEKEIALEQIKQMKEEVEDIKNERDLVKKTNREMKEKLHEINKIKDDLVQQNNTLLYQRNTLQCLLLDKDKQIEKLVSRDALEDPAVMKRIETLQVTHKAEQASWENQMKAMTKDIEERDAQKEELQNMVDSRNEELHKMCRAHEGLKQDHLTFVEKFKEEVAKKEFSIITLIEALKRLKTETNAQRDKLESQDKDMAGMKEQIRVKDIEISVLGEAKALYEDRIKMYTCEKESVCQIAREYELQIECARARLKELENYKYALDRQLTETKEQLQEEKEHNLIQEKILEDSRETVRMLKCRLKQCCRQLHKSDREREMLLNERC